MSIVDVDAPKPSGLPGQESPPSEVPSRSSTVRQILDRARQQEGVALLATALRENLTGSLEVAGEDDVRVRGLEQPLPLEAVMTVSRILDDLAATAKTDAEMLLELPVRHGELPDLGIPEPPRANPIAEAPVQAGAFDAATRGHPEDTPT